MSINSFCAEAPRRAVAAMLRALGGSEIAIRVGQPMGGLDTRGLGLQQYNVCEIKLSPAMVRQTKPSPDTQWEVVVPAAEIETKLGPDPEAVAISLRSGTAMVWNNKVLRIASVACEQFAGREYLYRITLGA